MRIPVHKLHYLQVGDELLPPGRPFDRAQEVVPAA